MTCWKLDIHVMYKAKHCICHWCCESIHAYSLRRYLGSCSDDKGYSKHEIVVHMQVEAYNDVDYVGSILDRRSTLGYCTFIEGNLVTWMNKNQPVVGRLSAKAYYRAMTLGICEFTWIITLLNESRVNVEELMWLYYDNKATISITYNLVQYHRITHVKVDKHVIK